MKKVLLFTLAALCLTTAVSAQRKVKGPQKKVLLSSHQGKPAFQNAKSLQIKPADKVLQLMNQSNLPKAVAKAEREAEVKHQALAKNGLRKAPYISQDGKDYCLYVRPIGSWFSSNWRLPTLVVPPFAEYTYTGFSSAAPYWTVNGKTVDDNRVDDNKFTDQAFPLSVTYYPNEQQIAATFPIPSFGMEGFNTTVNLGDMSETWTTESLAGVSGVMVADTINEMTVYDPTNAWLQMSDNSYFTGSYPYPVSAGVIDYSFGSNHISLDEDGVNPEDSIATGVSFFFFVDKPLSPLYIEYVNASVITQTKFFSGDQKISLNFRSVKYVEDNGETYKEPGDIIATFQAGIKDTLSTFSNVIGFYNEGNLTTFGTIRFADKVRLEDGYEYNNPVVIDEPFIVEVTGCDQEGVDIGFWAAPLNEYEYYLNDMLGIPATYRSMRMPNGETRYTTSWSYLPDMSFVGIFDYAEIQSTVYYSDGTEINDFNIAHFGMMEKTQIFEGDETLYEVAMNKEKYLPTVTTAMPWYDITTGYPNYYPNGKEVILNNDGSVTAHSIYGMLPDWIGMSVDDSERDFVYDQNGDATDFGYGESSIYLYTDQDLPEGVKGRAIYVNIYGYGVTSKDPLVAIQGEITMDQIENAKTGDEATYALSLSSLGYATFFDSQDNYELPAGLEAKVVTAYADGKLTYASLGQIVPKGVAALIVGPKNAATYKLVATEKSASYEGINLLQGSDVATNTLMGDNYLYYKLAYGKQGTDMSNTFGWYWGAENGASFQIEAHRAWLAVPANAGARFYELDGETTGIKHLTTNAQRNIIYDLQGRSVKALNAKGIYINNNKKVIIK